MIKRMIKLAIPLSNCIDQVSATLKFHIKYKHNPSHKIEESLIIDFRPNTGDIASPSENPLQPQLQLFIEVKFLQIVDETDRIHPSCHFLKVSDISEPLQPISPHSLFV